MNSGAGAGYLRNPSTHLMRKGRGRGGEGSIGRRERMRRVGIVEGR